MKNSVPKIGWSDVTDAGVLLGSDVVLAAPASLEQALSPAWLTAALAHRFPDIRITRVIAGPVVSRVSTNACFRIECDGPMPADLPADLCLKGYFGEVGRRAMRAGEPEAIFYRDLAASCGVRTLDSFYAEVDPESRHGVVITADVVARGGEFLQPSSDYTVEQVAESLAQLARLQARTWGASQWAHAPWLDPRMAWILAGRGVREIRNNFDAAQGTGVPIEVRDAERIVEAYGALASDVAGSSAWTVMHGDAHVGNVFLDRAQRPAFLDWQLVQRGAWFIDVGYHIASSLSVDDRRRSERDLLRGYLEALSTAGGPAPRWEVAWTDMHRGMLYGFFLWGITYKVASDVIAVLLERLGTAVDDHGGLPPRHKRQLTP